MIIQGFLDGLKPTPRLTVSEWADQNRYLSQESASEYGKWRTSRTPYLKKVMDCLSNYSSYREVIVMKGAQLGFTEAGSNWLGYIIDCSPAPTLMVQPTEDMMKKVSKTRIDPMINCCPTLQLKISSKSRDKNNTIKQKKFPGGILLMTTAESPAGLRSMPIKYLFLDEIDAYPYDLNGEGSPISLAEARTRTFSNKKIFKISTPTVKNGSVVESEFKKTDQNYYYVPCPHCGEYFVMKFDYLSYDKDNLSDVKMACPNCGALIEERHKTEMLANGEWRPTKESNIDKLKIGFHISSLYSPFGWYSWADAVRDFVKAQDDPSLMKTFVNTVLGETTEEKGEFTNWQIVYGKRDDYEQNKIPNNDIILLTMGVDIQKDRIEYQVIGWTVERQSYSIDYGALLGNTTQNDVWAKLEEVLNQEWITPNGSTMTLSRTAIDSGYNTAEVYSFCRQHLIKTIPIKGQDKLNLYYSPPRQVEYSRNGKKIGGLKVWNIGVSKIKKEFYSWLTLEDKNNSCYCHFPQYDEKFFEGLCAEEWIEKSKQWKKHYERNEPLDTWVYARAAAIIEGLDRKKEVKKPVKFIKHGFFD